MQSKLLLSILNRNKNTRYGQKHNFSLINNFVEYQNSVPISDYSTYKPMVEEMALGGKNILFPDEVYKYVSSSGSVSAPKVVPLTKHFIEKSFTPFFRSFVQLLVAEEPEIAQNFDKVLNLKWDGGRRVGNLKTGQKLSGLSQIDFSSDLSDVSMMEPGMNSAWSNVPEKYIQDLQRVYVRIRLAAEHDIRYVIGINPRFISNVAELINDKQDELISDIRNGTVLGEQYRDVKPNPLFANYLEKTISSQGRLYPRALWKNVKGLICWDGSIPTLYMDRMKNLYGQSSKVFPAPLALSEANLALPFNFNLGHQKLSVETTVFEFRPIADLDARPISDFNELRQGSSYDIIVTTHAGLYRYSTGDLLRIEGFEDGIPLVKYIGRSNIKSDHNIPEDILLESLIHLKEKERIEIISAFFSTRIVNKGTLKLFIETSHNHSFTEEASQNLEKYISQKLKGRHSDFKLKKVIIESLPSGSFYNDWCKFLENGYRPPQIKDKILRDPSDFIIENA